MKKKPKYSTLLRVMRTQQYGTREVLSDLLDVSSESIRRVESGEQIPSNKLLLNWLEFCEASKTKRKLVVTSVLKEREIRVQSTQQYVELAGLIVETKENVINEILSLFVDVGVDETSLLWVETRLKYILSKK